MRQVTLSRLAEDLVLFLAFASLATGQVTITEFPIPTPASCTRDESAKGPDGKVWFTEFSGNSLGKITPTGTITEFPLPTPNSNPRGIVAGPDGNLWFTETSTARNG